jgi:fructose-1,6-bisphosphatase/inositol monophosphatase family enzyme
MTVSALGPLEYALPKDVADHVHATAISAARIAGEIQMHHFRNSAIRCRRLLHDVKLETDRRCEKAIIDTVRERFPEHAILSEESGALPGAGEYTWIIDPLDGTVNFWHGLPFFCVSIACYRNGGPPNGKDAYTGAPPGAPVAGVILLPFSRELFVALPGRGAFLNGRPIRVTSSESASDAVVTVSFGKTPEAMRRMTRRLEVLLPRVRKARCLGAVAAELAYIAAGFLDGLVYEGIKLWDFAAGKILLEEAGGFLKAMETETDEWRVTAGTGGLRETLMAVF